MIPLLQEPAPAGAVRLVRYAPAGNRRSFLRILDGFGEALRSAAVRDALGPEISAGLAAREEEIRARLATELRLVVVGDFKRGKSTLLNALLGAPLLPTDVAPETLTINEVRPGEETEVLACLADGGQVRLLPEDLIRRRLTLLLAGLPAPVTHVEIRAPLAGFDGICLVDTPGTGDLSREIDRRVQEYLIQADAVIFMVSALSPLSETERAFLRLAILPQELPKVVFVVNMVDKIAAAPDADRLVAGLRERIARLVPGAPVFAVSAYDELCRVQGAERPQPRRADALAGAFAELRAHLETTVLLHRETLQVARAVQQAGRMLDRLAAQVAALREGSPGEGSGETREDPAELGARVDRRKAELAQRVQTLGAEACGWLDAFLDRLESEAVARLKRSRFEDVRRHFGFFLADALREAVLACLGAHRAALEAELDESLRAAVGGAPAQELPAVLAEVGRAAAEHTFDEAPWAHLDTLQLLMRRTQSGLCRLASDLLLRQQRLLDEREQVAAYQKRLRDALPDLRRDLRERVTALYDEIAGVLLRRIEETARPELEAAAAAVRRSGELQARRAEERFSIEAGLEQAMRAADAARAALTGLQARLWLERAIPFES